MIRRIPTTLMVAGLVALAAAPARAGGAEDDPRATEARAAVEGPAAERPAVELTLAEALERAAAANLGIRIQASTLDVARQSRRAAWAAFHPTLGMDYTYNPGMDHSLQRMAGSLLESLYRNYNATANASLTNRFVTGTELTVSWFHLSSRSERIKDEFQELLESISGVTDPITTSFTARASIELRQNLLQGLGWWYNLGGVRQAALAESAEEIAYDATVAETLAAVIKAYLELHYAERSVEIARSSVELALSQREVTEAQIGAGQLPPSDLLKLDETVATRRQEELEAELSLRRAEVSLRSLLVADHNDDLARRRLRTVALPASPVPPRDMVTSQETALLRNADLRRQELDLRSREIAVQMARQDLLPVLDLTGSLALNGVGENSSEGLQDVFGGNHPYWGVGLSLTVPLTNRADETAYRQRKAEVETSLLTLASLQESTLAAVENTCTQVISYEEQVRVAETRVALAEQNVEAEQARYAAGRSTTREVLAVQQSLRDARLAMERARINLWSARVDLEEIRGTLLETLGVREIAP